MHVPEYAKTVGWVMDRCRADWQVAPRDRAGAAPSPDEVEEFVMEWMRRQAFLLAEWNRVGFVHGVLNTDNISLAGLTLDLGPCAMINGYDPERSFSSIDHAGRYAFGRQGEVMEWNTGVLLSCLLPLLDPEPLENPSSRAVEKAGRLLASFQSLYKEALFEMHGRKLGLHAGSQHHTNSNSLIGDWLSFLTRHKADYSLSYMDLESRLLSRFTGVTGDGENDAFWSYAAPQVPPMDWVEAWLEAVSMDPALAVKQMRQANPTLIPRNHLVEEVLDAWVRRDDPLPLNEFLGLLRDPYLRSGTVLRRNQPPPGGDEAYCTYCGT
jgi:uncharacterized protein YdiU (UPF0061 family)